MRTTAFSLALCGSSVKGDLGRGVGPGKKPWDRQRGACFSGVRRLRRTVGDFLSGASLDSHPGARNRQAWVYPACCS
jgi:hypothetical protein